MNVEITPLENDFARILLDGIPVACLTKYISPFSQLPPYYATDGMPAMAGINWKSQDQARQDITTYLTEGTLPGDNDEAAGNNINPPLCSAEEATDGTTGQRVAPAACHSERKGRTDSDKELMAVLENLINAVIAEDECRIPADVLIATGEAKAMLNKWEALL